MDKFNLEYYCKSIGIKPFFESKITKGTSTESKVDEKFKNKGYKKLSSFEKIPITKLSIEKYKDRLLYSCCPGSREKGYFYIDKDDKLVAVIGVEPPVVNKDKSKVGKLDKYYWISVLEVLPKYRGYGLSRQLLDVATGELKGDFLTVTHDNEVAIKLYKSYGFKITKASYERIQNGTSKDGMYVMFYKRPKDIELID